MTCRVPGLQGVLKNPLKNDRELFILIFHLFMMWWLLNLIDWAKQFHGRNPIISSNLTACRNNENKNLRFTSCYSLAEKNKYLECDKQQNIIFSGIIFHSCVIDKLSVDFMCLASRDKSL